MAGLLWSAYRESGSYLSFFIADTLMNGGVGDGGGVK